MVSRKTIEHKIIMAVPGMNEDSMDSGLPFYETNAAKQIDELAGKIYSLVVGFAEKAAVVAYGRK